MLARPIDNINKISNATIVEESVVEVAANTCGEHCKSNDEEFLFYATKEENQQNQYQSYA